MARQFLIKADPDLPAPQLTLDYAGELNAQQLAAVQSGSGPSLVVAGAGTGKTRTLIYRLAWLVETGVPPEGIVLLTFTRRAARDMMSRAAHLLDGRCEAVRGGTFHAFCLSVLRQYAPRIGYPNTFTILDGSDAADAIDVLRSRMPGRERGKRFPKKRTLQTMFSAVRNRGGTLAERVEEDWPQFMEHLPAIQALYEGFQGYKRAHGLMDYDDLLIETLRLFREDPGILRAVASKCRVVLVDEYQDTNRAQAALVEAFASVHGNVMVVGDDAQSIYRFRGADFRNILEFPDRFPGARVLKLEHNYRSTQPILDLANHLLARAHRRYDKALFTERTGGERPVLVPTPDTRFESRFVAQVVLDLREQGIPLKDQAVLFRSGHHAYDLEMELNRRGIPFVKYGGMKLSEAAHIKDVVAVLRVAENVRDVIAWNRLLQLLEGIGPKTAARIVDWITAAEGDPFEIESRPFSPGHAAALTDLFATVREVRGATGSPAEQLERIMAWYEPVLTRVYYEDHPKRQQDLDQLVALAGSFASRELLLSSLALDPVELTAVDVEPEDDDEAPLVLSTIHSAKGLEFRAVFLIHAFDGALPSAYAVGSTDDLDEELRLLYVAVTRAAEHLFVSYPTVQARRMDGQYFTGPSRFLEGVPESLLEPGTLIEAPSPPPGLPEPPPIP